MWNYLYNKLSGVGAEIAAQAKKCGSGSETLILYTDPRSVPSDRLDMDVRLIVDNGDYVKDDEWSHEVAMYAESVAL